MCQKLITTCCSQLSVHQMKYQNVLPVVLNQHIPRHVNANRHQSVLENVEKSAFENANAEKIFSEMKLLEDVFQKKAAPNKIYIPNYY